MVLIAGFIFVVFVYSLASRRLDRTVLTAPILFTAGGALMALSPEILSELRLDASGLMLVAELGLVMTLFTDTSRIAPRMLTSQANLPVRLLSTGMLLTIALGALCAMVVFGNLSWWEAGILGAILAPTDAGLGQIIVASPRVPQRIRRALNVEAGLNDGLAVPFLLFFIAVAAATGENIRGSSVLARFLVEQLGYGALIGLAIGLAGGWLLVARVWTQFSIAVVLYAVLSLTLIRMVPVAIALRGTGLSRATVLFMGWFGPRGLASIVLGLVYLESELSLPGESTVRLAVMATVLLSIVAHGLTAVPGIDRYASAIGALDPAAPEHRADECGNTGAGSG
ncbi:MAG: cation:proton antiporter [Burkholderiales bacterium]|nr:cation:proton antiporter [Burkholderiales bacterium]